MPLAFAGEEMGDHIGRLIGRHVFPLAEGQIWPKRAYSIGGEELASLGKEFFGRRGGRRGQIWTGKRRFGLDAIDGGRGGKRG